VTTTTTSAPAPQKLSVFSPKYLSITLSTLTVLALAAFDGMAVAAALPRIGADLGVARLSWVLTSFSLTSTIALLIAGPAIDAVGVRTVYRFTIVTFFIGSLLCAVSTTLEMLVGARIVQGIGGGMIMAVTIANVGLAYPPELRSRAFAANSSVWGIMAVAGPAAAAFMLNVVSWRGIFFVAVPLVAVAAVVGWNRMGADHHERQQVHFDVRGVIILSLFVAVLLIGLSALEWWSAPSVAIGLGLFGMYWIHSGKIESPVLARRHFAHFPFGLLNLIPLTFFAGPLSIDAYIPIYVQGALGKSGTVSAFAVAFLAVGWTSGSQIVSRILDKVKNTTVMVAGFAMTLPALAVALTFNTTTPVAVVFALSFVQGLGIGSMTNATLSLLQQAASANEMGRASSAHQFMRNFGSTLGTALAGAVIFFVVNRRIGSVEPVQRLLKGKDVALSGPTREAIAAGFRAAVLLAFLLTCLGLVAALQVRKRFAGQEDSAPASP
jgi:MFS family permease